MTEYKLLLWSKLLFDFVDINTCLECFKEVYDTFHEVHMLLEYLLFLLMVNIYEVIMVRQIGICQIVGSFKLLKPELKGFCKLLYDSNLLTIIFYFEKFLNRMLTIKWPRVESEKDNKFHVKSVDFDFELPSQWKMFFLQHLESVWEMN